MVRKLQVFFSGKLLFLHLFFDELTPDWNDKCNKHPRIDLYRSDSFSLQSPEAPTLLLDWPDFGNVEKCRHDGSASLRITFLKNCRKSTDWGRWKRFTELNKQNIILLMVFISKLYTQKHRQIQHHNLVYFEKIVLKRTTFVRGCRYLLNIRG